MVGKSGFMLNYLAAAQRVAVAVGYRLSGIGGRLKAIGPNTALA